MPEVQDILPKISLRSFYSNQEFSEIFRNNTRERYALFYVSNGWKKFGASNYPEVMFL